jgi:hypothetical protein
VTQFVTSTRAALLGLIPQEREVKVFSRANLCGFASRELDLDRDATAARV